MEDLVYQDNYAEIFQLNSFLTSLETIRANVAAEGMSSSVVPALEAIDSDIFNGFNTKRFTELPSATYQNYALEAMSGTKIAIIFAMITAGLTLLIKLFEWIVNTALDIQPIKTKGLAPTLKNIHGMMNAHDFGEIDETVEAKEPADDFISRVRVKSEKFTNVTISRIARMINRGDITDTEGEQMFAAFNSACIASNIKPNSPAALVLSSLLVEKKVLPKSLMLLNIPGLGSKTPMSPVLITRLRELCYTCKDVVRQTNLAYSEMTRVQKFPVDVESETNRVMVPALVEGQFRKAGVAIDSVSRAYRSANTMVQNAILTGGIIEATENFLTDTAPDTPDHIHIASWDVSLDPKLAKYSEDMTELTDQFYGFADFLDDKSLNIVSFNYDFGKVIRSICDERNMLRTMEEAEKGSAQIEPVRKLAAEVTDELKDLQSTISQYSRATQKQDNIMNYEIPVYSSEGQHEIAGFVKAANVFNGIVKTVDGVSKPVKDSSVLINKYYSVFKAVTSTCLRGMAENTK